MRAAGNGCSFCTSSLDDSPGILRGFGVFVHNHNGIINDQTDSRRYGAERHNIQCIANR